MIRHILSAGASVLALTLTVPAAAQDAHEMEGVHEAFHVEDGEASSAAVATPTMSFGTWGFDPETLSPSIDPGDDFFAYANQKWLDANPLPPEYSRFGAFNLLREKSTSDVKTLVDGLVSRDAASLSADERRIVAAYNAYNDNAAIDAAGLAPAQPYLDAIRGTDDLAELVTLWSKPGYSSPLGGYVSVDAKEPTRYSVYLGSGGLGLPDRDYYLDTSEKGQDIQAKYRDYLTFLYEQAGYQNAAAMAQQVYDFEDQIDRRRHARDDGARPGDSAGRVAGLDGKGLPQFERGGAAERAR